MGGYFRMVKERLNPPFGLEYAQARLVLSLCPQGTGTSLWRSWLCLVLGWVEPIPDPTKE